MAKKAEIKIGAKDETKGAFASVQSGFARLRASANGVGESLAKFARKAKVAVLALAAGAALAVREFIKFEAAARPFARFTGGIEQATRHMKDLQAIGRMGVIPTDDLVAASRELMQFSDGLLGSAGDMKALADVAATTGNDVGQVTAGVTRFIQAVGQGRNVQSAARDLERMGVVSLGARERLRELQAQGASTEQMFAVLQSEINKFAGGVEDDMDTGAAAFGRIKEAGKTAMVEIGQSIMTSAAPAFDELGQRINDALDDGTINAWADGFVDAISRIVDALAGLKSWWRDIQSGLAHEVAYWSGRAGGLSVQDASTAAAMAFTGQEEAFARKDKARADKREATRTARRERTEAMAKEGFGAGASGADLSGLFGDDDDEKAKAGRSGPSNMARRVLDRLRRSGEVEEFSTDGMGGMLGGVRQQAQDQLRSDEQRDLIRKGVDIQEQIRDLLKKNLEAA